MDWYPLKTDIGRFPNKTKIEEIATEDWILVKIKITCADTGKAVDSAEKSGCGRVFFYFKV